MRSAERSARLALAVALLAGLVGCASVMEPIKSMRDAVMPSSSTPPTATTNANAATGARTTGTASAGAAAPAPVPAGSWWRSPPWPR